MTQCSPSVIAMCLRLGCLCWCWLRRLMCVCVPDSEPSACPMVVMILRATLHVRAGKCNFSRHCCTHSCCARCADCIIFAGITQNRQPADTEACTSEVDRTAGAPALNRRHEGICKSKRRASLHACFWTTPYSSHATAMHRKRQSSAPGEPLDEDEQEAVVKELRLDAARTGRHLIIGWVCVC